MDGDEGGLFGVGGRGVAVVVDGLFGGDGSERG